MKQRKPDGFVAWHEQLGVDKTSFAALESGVANQMTRAYEDSKHFGYVHALDRGWRIRPVKLVFLDEPTELKQDE